MNHLTISSISLNKTKGRNLLLNTSSVRVIKKTKKAIMYQASSYKPIRAIEVLHRDQWGVGLVPHLSYFPLPQISPFLSTPHTTLPDKPYLPSKTIIILFNQLYYTKLFQLYTSQSSFFLVLNLSVSHINFSFYICV